MSTTTTTKPSREEVRAEAKRLGITRETAGRPIADLVKAAQKTDDPFGYLSTFAPGADGPGTTEATPQGEGEVTAAAAFPADEWREVAWIEWALQIPAAEIRQAREDGAFGQYKKAGDTFQLLGGDVHRWIAGKKIRCSVSKEAADLHRRIHSKPGPKPEPARPQTLGERVREAAADREKAETQYETENRQQALNAYLGFLLRADEPSELEDRDVDHLSFLWAELGVTDEQFESDRRLVETAQRLTVAHDQRQDAHAAVKEARSQLEAARKKFEADERRLSKALNGASGRLSECDLAPGKLHMLARRRPEFFEASDPPKLRAVIT